MFCSRWDQLLSYMPLFGLANSVQWLCPIKVRPGGIDCIKPVWHSLWKRLWHCIYFFKLYLLLLFIFLFFFFIPLRFFLHRLHPAPVFNPTYFLSNPVPDSHIVIPHLFRITNCNTREFILISQG